MCTLGEFIEQLIDLLCIRLGIIGQLHYFLQPLYANPAYIGLGHVELVLAIGKVSIFFNIKDVLVALAAEEQSIFGQALDKCLRIPHLSAIPIDPLHFGWTMLGDLTFLNPFFLHNSLDSLNRGVISEEGVLLLCGKFFVVGY